MNNIYKELLEKLETSNGSVLVTEINKHYRSISKKIETNLPADIRKPKIIDIDEDNMMIIEAFYPEERLIILGGGHIAVPLADFGSKVGFSVTVVDDRPFFANKARFPLAKDVICEEFTKAIELLNITKYDYIVIITRGHRYDTICLEKLLQLPETKYIGMIGSKRRINGIKQLLSEEKHNKGRLDRICAPIGLNIGALTPEEISIAIIAEIISRRRQNRDNRSDVDYQVLEKLARDTSSKAVITVIASKGSVPRQAGAKMIVYQTGQTFGSIGGGCSEAEVARKAMQIIGTRTFRLETVDLTGDLAEDEGMVCGGIMTVLIEDC